MDKAKAIEKLNDIRCHVKETSAEEQALVMAINALKAQLSQEDTTSDTISRQAAIDAICESANDLQDVLIPVYYRKLIENLPSAQPEPKEGHWIGGDGSYICSECNSSPLDFIETMGLSFDAYVETPMNYCPNCGAKMKGE